MPKSHGDRGSKERKSKKRTSIPVRKSEMFGDIPQVERSITNVYGKTVRYYEYDPDFRPDIPAGAVEGDVHRQRFCPLCHTPRYFYIDQNRECIQCGDSFMFAAAEQKYWYESLQFHFDSVAVRCRRCRKQKRNIKALNNQIGEALTRLNENPDDPETLVELARSTVQLFQATGKGDLHRAISNCRKAYRIWEGQRDALYWEGIAHHLQDRPLKAKPLLEEYIKRRKKKDGVKLRNEAQSILSELT